ncbi:RNA polymerase Rpb6 [Thermovirga lienii DSM 17291]|jgi:DNA-directed RNA polymerase subunit K/omega|uniref:DNA-directed RNA polymerase subunit omega n=1 Tax=Thermovirga lienii (strain ATCC BAA-1197 / DSM 17291 / Cas60314) TaxID=580340 RepID=G7V573_THELD|nr:DNA-directed RNA polymerase subunit omega [Thermovirga lienii]MDN5318124.1 hypothetical protein [Thermovirga sp.]AER66856.1 RNA polymerase Rpb6 [Thermovirga lienii DSM 17291]KUK42058.1 MAG: RNA polymerase Rpb6 [Thermovirga lienii]MDN5367335.1 hypothetical protein [Thermovirga sp.]HCD71929.1 DNA-directed RNA polymerase subunit omega [Thermovirga lienii]
MMSRGESENKEMNKYLAAMVVAKRARQISEDKGARLFEAGWANPVLAALDEFVKGKLDYILPASKRD